MTSASLISTALSGVDCASFNVAAAKGAVHFRSGAVKDLPSEMMGRRQNIFLDRKFSNIVNIEISFDFK